MLVNDSCVTLGCMVCTITHVLGISVCVCNSLYDSLLLYRLREYALP